MVKVSISLPNNTQITLESEESEVLHEVVGLVLRDLPRDLMQGPSGENGHAENAAGQNGAEQKGSSVASAAAAAISIATPETAPVVPNAPAPVLPTETPQATAPSEAPEPRREPAGRPRTTPRPRTTQNTSAPASRPAVLNLDLEAQPASARQEFTSFCQNTNPLGDMRRVVVAAEGASRYFAVEGVNADDLGLLFDLAGWRRPGNFTQTLRNAARAKFGWLERIPGRSGRYAATELGRSVTLDS